jgi:carbon storage regulator
MPSRQDLQDSRWAVPVVASGGIGGRRESKNSWQTASGGRCPHYFRKPGLTRFATFDYNFSHVAHEGLARWLWKPLHCGFRNAEVFLLGGHRGDSRSGSKRHLRSKEMLVLSRRPGEEIVINGNIRLRVVEVDGNRVRLGVVAPRSVSVDRSEVHERRRAVVGEELACAR